MIFIGGCFFFMLISWEFAISLCMIGLIALGLFRWERTGFPLKFRLKWDEWVGILSKDKSWIWVATPFFLVLISGFYSDNTGYWLDRLQVKIPFLVLPLAIMGQRLNRRIYEGIFYLLALLFSGVAMYVMARYLSDPLYYNTLLNQGGSLPTPSNHIRFSMAGAIAGVSALYLLLNGFFWRWRGERYLLGFMALFIIGFLHFLSVRTGLMLLYTGLGLGIIYWVFKTRRWWLGLGIFLAMMALPVIAFYTIPAFHAKVGYVRWDIQQTMQGDKHLGSDNNRYTSLVYGWDIFRENPLIGIGAGDLKDAMDKRYLADSPHLNPLLPHNQWLVYLAGTGLLGGLLAFLGFIYPLVVRHRYQNFLFTLVCLSFFLAFLTEPTLENNFGISLYLLLLLPAFGLSDEDQRQF
jgi:O-antigen ligase